LPSFSLTALSSTFPSTFFYLLLPSFSLTALSSTFRLTTRRTGLSSNELWDLHRRGARLMKLFHAGMVTAKILKYGPVPKQRNSLLVTLTGL
jgi:hypothetical protein